MRYDWFRALAKQRLNFLNNASSKDPNVQRQIDYAKITINELLQSSTIQHSALAMSDHKQIEYILRQAQRLIKCDFLWTDFTSFHTCSTKPMYFSDFPELKLSNRQLLANTRTFFENATDENTLMTFNTLFSKHNKYTHIIRNTNADFYGECFFIPYFNDFYIQVKPHNTFDDIATLTHEYGHGIQFIQNYNPSLRSKNVIFSEIISSFFEFLSYFYFTDNSVLGKEAITSLAINYDYLTGYGDSLDKFIQLIQKLSLPELNSAGQMFDVLLENKSLFEEDNFLEVLLTRNINNDAVYLFAFIVVIEIIDIYFVSPKSAFDLLQKIIDIDLNLSPEEYYLKLIELGIVPNASVSSFEEQLKRRLARYKMYPMSRTK